MSLSNHWETCWRDEGHPACRLRRIHELEVKVQTLETQLQYERTGHLTEQDPLVDYINDALVKMAETSKTCFGVPCGDLVGEPASRPATHDHIEPPIVSGGPTWSARNDEPPSFTP